MNLKKICKKKSSLRKLFQNFSFWNSPIGGPDLEGILE
jgi:hypothetical protein